MNTCKNCKHFENVGHEFIGYGNCGMSHIVVLGEMNPDNIDKIVCLGTRNLDSFVVGENFGCIHFEQKEQ